MFESFNIHDFRWVWFSTFASYMAFGMQALARGWLVLRLSDDSPLALSVVMAAYILPMTFMSLIGGALADRIPKKHILYYSQIANTCTTAILATLDLSGLIRFWQLIVLSIISGSMDAVNLPSRTSIISDLVPGENLMNAVSLSNSSTSLTRTIGPALAGVLILFIETAGVFYFISGCYLLSVLCISRVETVTKHQRQEPGSVLRDITSGLQYAAGDPMIRGLILFVLMPLFFGFSIQYLLPAWAREALDVQSQGLGALMTAIGAGSLVGSLILAALHNLKKRGLWLILISLLWGGVIMLFSRSGSYAVALPCLFFIGVMISTHTSLHMTLMQVYAGPDMRGRMMSLVMMSFGLTPLSTLPIGAVAEKIGTPNALGLSGILLLGTTILFVLLYPAFRRID
jgi:MFS family permease